MGVLTNVIKSSSKMINSQLKSQNIVGDITRNISSFSSNLDVPAVKIPDPIKNLNIENIKVEDSAQNTIPLAKKAFSTVSSKIPSEIGGIQLPTIPDIPKIDNLSSIGSMVKSIITGKALDFNTLGIDKIINSFSGSDIVKSTDLSSLTSGFTEFPDFSKEMNSFDATGIQNDINSIGREIPGFEDIELTKFV